MKAELLESVGVPLIYTRSVDEDRRFIRFFTPDGETEVFYNPITQDGRTELEAFLTAYSSCPDGLDIRKPRNIPMTGG